MNNAETQQMKLVIWMKVFALNETNEKKLLQVDF